MEQVLPKQFDTKMSSSVETRVLVISDTHSSFHDEAWPTFSNTAFDLAIHCGDLTQGSSLHEFRQALKYLKQIPAPIKLIFAGNHDITLDNTAYQGQLAAASISIHDPEAIKTYGLLGDAEKLLRSAEAVEANIMFLEEGISRLRLPNGADISIFASPWTPRQGSGGLAMGEAEWAFQYDRERPRQFEIMKGTDIVITHGPPKGILDYVDGKRLGCDKLFGAVALARPKLHCFGHLHSGWGAKLVTWRDQQPTGAEPSHFTHIDNEKSTVFERLASYKINKLDDETSQEEKKGRMQTLVDQGYKEVGCNRIKENQQTLFVNAAFEGDQDMPIQPPMVVTLQLPRFQDKE